MPTPTEPSDPTTPLGEAAAALFEMHQSLIAAGFTDFQACVMLGTSLAVNAGNMGGGDADGS